MVNVRLEKVTKRFGEVIAADRITLTIKHGEFFTFLGPSGCGKTTTLRIIAGLEYPDEGKLYFDDKDVTDEPPYKRNTGMVFQNYALWPHMTVFDNIAYGLKIRKLPKEEIRRKVLEVLDLVKLRGLENRYPTQLSGGQQQRVALARALVIEPAVLLLDEPLSNLDAKLRIEMREEIKRIQKKLGITTIYVTHDQEEAMVISDRIAVMNRGRIMQVDEPKELYRRPKNLFVASFLGRCTILKGIVKEVEEDLVTLTVGNIVLKGIIPSRDIKLREGDKAVIVLRPQDFEIEKTRKNVNRIEGVVEWISFVGPYSELRIKSNGLKILVNVDPDFQVKIGDKIAAYISYDRTIVFPLGEAEAAYKEEIKV
ncbi:MAG: spermidine/putrescine ABC transporter ATP-binding protein [Desulfurococcales archaeon ex4484_217_2]|nr:MAG: spermidine/putrescine ABC transporter ATP-binding protein [Desulfurococcales archaeon ex4484_217_2]